MKLDKIQSIYLSNDILFIYAIANILRNIIKYFHAFMREIIPAEIIGNEYKNC